MSDAGDLELDAWEHTVESMESLAAERSEEGWATLTVTAADTAPTPPAVEETDRWGLIYTVSSTVSEEFRTVHDAGFDRYDVFRRRVGDRLFLVTELQSRAARTAVFIAGAVDVTVADDLIAAAARRGELYTHLQLLDWTELGSVHHDDPTAFFPSLE
ncbi:hypothetical protein BRD18_08180 [Halobacteriales archaeon SW_7_71_33]|nr:MAG: hypothetical protein BRD18_08180 [Halobacteriales archaeon SW_7_71_33]